MPHAYTEDQLVEQPAIAMNLKPETRNPKLIPTEIRGGIKSKITIKIKNWGNQHSPTSPIASTALIKSLAGQMATA